MTTVALTLLKDHLPVLASASATQNIQPNVQRSWRVRTIRDVINGDGNEGIVAGELVGSGC